MSKELKPTPKSPKMITLEIMMDYKSDGVDYAEENGIEAIKTRLKQEVEAYKAELREEIRKKKFTKKSDLQCGAGALCDGDMCCGGLPYENQAYNRALDQVIALLEEKK